MSFYSRHILPKVVHCVCGLKPMMRQRAKIIPEASGKVLEIGIGSGLNAAFYNIDKVSHLIGIDPTPHKSALFEALEKNNISHEIIIDTAEKIPLGNNSIDTIVSTYTLCTVGNIEETIEECRRVLKPHGKLLFVEHGLSPDKSVSRIQNRVNPVWQYFSGGCQLNRNIPELLDQYGFQIVQLESMYLPGWKPATWNVWGSAITKP